MSRILSLMTVALAVATGAAACPSESPERLPGGNWGGQHIGLVATDTGATIEYDCAAGRIDGPLTLGANGAFEWTGVHFPGQGGPIRIDQPVNAHTARYTGRADSESLRLTLTLVDGSQPPQSFTLRRGGQASVFKCL
jgi:hypothetical protein